MPIEKWQLFLSQLFRFGLYGLPLSAVLVTGFALVWGGRSAAVAAAQVYGGPTEGVAALALRVRGLTSNGVPQESEGKPLQGEVELLAHLVDGSESHARGSLAEGLAEVKLSFAHTVSGPVSLTVRMPDSGVELARGAIQLRASDWSRATEQRGGWLGSVGKEPLVLRVGIEAGVLAVPFQGTLLVRIDTPSAAAIQIEIEAEGVAGFEQHPFRVEIPSSAPPILRLPIRPIEHAATLSVRARVNGSEVEWRGALPVVPGALNVVRDKEQLVIRSPIPRQTAYLSVVNKTERLMGSIVALTADAEGAVGYVPFANAGGPLWAVISSDFDARSPGLVGWPLDTTDTRNASADLVPGSTFDVRDVLLLDGFAEARVRQSRDSERIRGSAACYCFVAGLISALLVFWRLRYFDGGAFELLTSQQNVSFWSRLLAAFCVLLGFSLLAVFVLWQV